MFLQPKSYEKKADVKPLANLLKKELSALLKQNCADLAQFQQYRCPLGSKSEPLAQSMVEPTVIGMAPQQARSVIHALSHADSNGMRQPPVEQKLPAYIGSQSCRHPPLNKSKPYYHTTYNELLSKPFVYDIMMNLVVAQQEKSIPFHFLVGDMLTYLTIVQMKMENSSLFKKIIPILGAFHQQISDICAVYKRFKSSGIAETIVAAGVVVEGSIDKALRGKHYRWGIHCIMLWREALFPCASQKNS